MTHTLQLWRLRMSDRREGHSHQIWYVNLYFPSFSSSLPAPPSYPVIPLTLPPSFLYSLHSLRSPYRCMKRFMKLLKKRTTSTIKLLKKRTTSRMNSASLKWLPRRKQALEGQQSSGVNPSYYTLYTPFIHPHYHIYTYVHPLYVYIHHTYT